MKATWKQIELGSKEVIQERYIIIHNGGYFSDIGFNTIEECKKYIKDLPEKSSEGNENYWGKVAKKCVIAKETTITTVI